MNRAPMHWLVPSYGVTVVELLVVAAVALLVVVAGVVVLVRRRRARLAPVAEYDAVGRPVQPDAAEDDPSTGDRLERLAAPVETEAAPRSLRERLRKPRRAWGGSVASVLEGDKLTDATWDELAEALIKADVGVQTAFDLTDAARATPGLQTPADALAALRAEINARLDAPRELARRNDGPGPSVWLVVGVNGSGKTTTIGKLANQQTRNGVGVLLAAGDTFRAAAGEQLTVWAERAEVPIVTGAAGADPASVVFDAVESAAAGGADLVIADTAGRLHTERNLMDELRKVRRVAEKGAGVVTETLLVIDATSGQNGLIQARQFTEAVDVTGVVLTKLDGSAKGGIVVAVGTELGVPVKLAGVGETIDDLVVFEPEEFTEALFA